MNTTLKYEPNNPWRERAAAEFAKLLAVAEARGFYGTASLTLTVQDGAIQHFRITVDKLIKP
jgi:hypothetical protein